MSCFFPDVQDYVGPETGQMAKSSEGMCGADG